MGHATRIAGLIGVLIVLAGCVGPAPGASGDPSPPPSSTAAHTAMVEVFFAHAQPTRITLIGEPHLVETESGEIEVVLESTLSTLIDGALQPVDPDYATLWGEGSELRAISRAGDVLTLDLHIGALTLGAEAESVAIAQLVWTATRIDPSIGSVQLTVDGSVVETLVGHVDITAPITREPPENVLSPLQITSPSEGETVVSPVTATGAACVFEATYSWILEGPGSEVLEGFGMASESCPARAAWQLDLGALAPGDYLLTLLEYSAEDGSVSSTDSKSFTVSG